MSRYVTSRQINTKKVKMLFLEYVIAHQRDGGMPYVNIEIDMIDFISNRSGLSQSTTISILKELCPASVFPTDI